MNTHFLPTLVGAAALWAAGGAAHAAVLTFNNPGLVDIGAGNVATYTEAGYTISGQAASFLPLDNALVGGFDTTPFSLKALGGGAFALLSLDAAFYDLGFGGPPGTLSVVGLRGGTQVASQTLNLGPVAAVSFGASWLNLTEVRFTGSSGFSLDNISAVPEPGTWAFTVLGLVGLFLQRRRLKPA